MNIKAETVMLTCLTVGMVLEGGREGGSWAQEAGAGEAKCLGERGIQCSILTSWIIRILLFCSFSGLHQTDHQTTLQSR